MVGAASRGRPAVYHFKRTNNPAANALDQKHPPHLRLFPFDRAVQCEEDEAEYVPILARNGRPGCSILLIRYLEPR